MPNAIVIEEWTGEIVRGKVKSADNYSCWNFQYGIGVIFLSLLLPADFCDP
jgi:hypothetical protein